MSKTPATQEPSMEEILSSIRRIISEDETESSPAQTQPDAAPAGFNGDHGAMARNGETVSPAMAGQPDIPAPAEEMLIKLEPKTALNGADHGENSHVAPPFAASQAHQESPAEAQPMHAEVAAPAAPATSFTPFSPPSKESTPEAMSEPLTLSQPFNGHSENGIDAGFGLPPEHEAQEAEPAEQVLDLTEMVASDGRVVKITPQGPSDDTQFNGSLTQNGFGHDYPDSAEQLTGGSAAFGASFGQAAQVEAGGVDEVSYADADLNGTPAYMAATDTGPAAYPQAAKMPEPAGQTPQDADNHLQSEPAAVDAFAELAGAEEQGGEKAMTQNPTDDNPGAQAAFGAGAFNGAAAGNGAGFDAMVQKMAEPMIRQWIEQNMPQMIEAIVRDEVARRLSGGG